MHRSNIGPNVAEQLAMLEKMRLIRGMETKLSEATAAGELPGPVHLYIGQEAVASGICAHLHPTDKITSTHRGHGHFLAKGGNPQAMMAEIFGRETGICKGIGGSMHVADVSIGILGANGIVSGGIGLAVGAALAAKLDGKGEVAVAFFGDGASNQGVLSEAYNLSALWKLPLIFVCEHNGFSEWSKSEAVTAGNIADRVAAYGIPSITVDGNDASAVWEAGREAVERARSDQGPTFVQAHTYRLHGHVEYEAGFLTRQYRSADEVADWRTRDPITIAEKTLVESGVPQADLDTQASEVSTIVEEAAQFARDSAWPDASIATQNMFVGA